MVYTEDFVREYVKCLVGNKSRKSVAFDLGIETTKLRLWQQGTKRISCSDLLLLKKNTFFDLVTLIEKTLTFQMNVKKEGRDILQHVLASSSNKEKIDCFISPQRQNRILKGENKLYFIDLINIINTVYSRLARFVSLSVDIEKSEYFKKVFEKDLHYMNSLKKDPFLVLLRQKIALNPVGKNELEKISLFFKLPTDLLKEKINHLLNIGILRLENGKYYANEIIHDTGLVSGASKSVQLYYRTYVHNHLLQCYKAKTKDNVKSAFLIYQSNKKLDEKIHQLSDQFYNELKSLIELEKSNKLDFDDVKFMEINFASLFEVK